LIVGFSSGYSVAAMPPYYAEIAPPHARGLMTGAHGSFLNLGYVLSAWIGQAHRPSRVMHPV
jgi:hypothetical protein